MEKNSGINQHSEEIKKAEWLGLTNDEVAFYNALEVNDSAIQY